MFFINLLSNIKIKKVLLPGIQVKDLKPISNLLSPKFLVVPLVFVSLISQIADNLKNLLSPREVQQIFSVRFYTKVLSSGCSSMNLSTIYAISKTLGPELETLSVLSVSERSQFLKDLQKRVILDKSVGKIISKPQLLYDPSLLMKHRNGLSLQTRSIMIASSIFSPNSVAMGMAISNINLQTILNSAKMFWLSLNLEDEEFDFLLRKEASSYLRKCSDNEKPFEEPTNSIESLKVLVFSECKSIFKFEDILSFSEDQVIIQGDNNLTPLERELGFMERYIMHLPDDIFIPDSQLGDVLLRASLDQRRQHKIQVENIFKKSNIFVDSKKNKLNLEILSKLKANKAIY
jgi:hypothetical protein